MDGCHFMNLASQYTPTGFSLPYCRKRALTVART
jgi:hypothetical protein